MDKSVVNITNACMTNPGYIRLLTLDFLKLFILVSSHFKGANSVFLTVAFGGRNSCPCESFLDLP